MKVLIATVTAGAGHVQAAAAVEEAWRGLRPEDAVERMDALDFTSRLYRKLYSEGYLKVIEHSPELWGAMFDRMDRPELLRRIAGARRILARLSLPKFIRHVRDFAPEVVVSTHFLPPEIIGRIKARSRGNGPFLATVVTDFEAHALWMEPAVNLYCVAAEETKARLIARGVKESAVVVSGIPIAGKFSRPVDTLRVRKELWLTPEQNVVLVLGGGMGMGPVAELLAELNRVPRPLQVVVVCGRNETLRAELLGKPWRHPTQVLGFVTNMQELLAVAAVVVTKPGGLTASEALAMGRPLFIISPIPGQEAANSDFLLEHGVAVKANRIEDVPYRIASLLGSRRLGGMARAARKMGRPLAAEAVCCAVLNEVFALSGSS